MLLMLSKCIFKSLYFWNMRILPGYMTPAIGLIISFTLLLMVLNWPFIKYPINITSFLGICSINLLVPPTNSELMIGCRQNMEVDYSQCSKYFPKQDLSLTHYIVNSWWLHFLVGLVHYVIQPGAVDKVMVITPILM